jgi:WD40 repeat protein
MYWKMTNLCEMWSYPHKSPIQVKNHFQRSGTITWKFLSSRHAISVYNSGKGFSVKIHDQHTYRFRGAHYESSGTVRKDSLCLDASEDRIVVGGKLSQKVWVFKVREFMLPPAASFVDRVIRGITNGGAPSYLTIGLYKYISAETGVSKVRFHPTNPATIAVLLPFNQLLEVWDVDERTRLHSFAVTTDTCYLLWRSSNLLLAAPLFSGILMAFDPKEGTKKAPLVGSIRRIDAIAVYENLCATGENQSVRLWSLLQGRGLVSWRVTKTFVSALLLNDTMLVSGSGSGIVKLWDLKTLLGSSVTTVAPLRRISMKGVLHYPIKDIFQVSILLNSFSLYLRENFESLNKKKFVLF